MPCKTKDLIKWLSAKKILTLPYFLSSYLPIYWKMPEDTPEFYEAVKKHIAQ